MSVEICAIAAMDEGRVIGADNKIPWHIPDDLKRFSRLTTGHTVLMGRKTYQSLPKKFRPLPGRENVVVTRRAEDFEAPSGVRVVSNPEEFIRSCKDGSEKITGDILWIIGGAEIYRLSMPYWDKVYLTLVSGRHEGDAFFPPFEDDFKCVSEEICEGVTYRTYHRLN